MPAPWPAPEPRTIATAALDVRVSDTTPRPGDLIDVDVYLRTPLDDLRGYQLHLAVSGGSAGALELVDIATTKRTVLNSPQKSVRSKATAKTRPAWTTYAGDWRAFNIVSGQMVVGLDTAGMQVEPGYLATFTYQVNKHAAGAFVIEVLHEDSDPAQRTYLFPTTPGDRIEITRATPAVVKVLR